MNFIKSALAAAGILAFAAIPASSSAGINVGTLTCEVESGVGYIIGSNRDVTCVYNSGGNAELYIGSISRLGLDIGVTDNQTIVWAVLAPGKIGKGALDGNYFGATAEATAIVGVGANVLVGGMKNSVALQPVSIQGQTGLDVVLAGTSLNLEAVNTK